MRSEKTTAVVAGVVLAGIALGGCGVGAGETPEDVGLRVTDRFGTAVVVDQPQAKVAGEDTVVRVLQRNATIDTSNGGTFVDAIAGRAGGEATDGTSGYWLYFRNGVLADQGSASVRVRTGDRIWWDRNDNRIANVQAVVGSFPAPFVGGGDGGPVPVELACTAEQDVACTTASERLKAAGVTATTSRLGSETGSTAPRIVVGPWADVRRDPAAGRLALAPKVSGVFARVEGTTLVPYRADGSAAAPRSSGWGLIAATRVKRDPPTWIVTGRTAADAAAAAAQLTASALAGRFAVVVREGTAQALPVSEAR